VYDYAINPNKQGVTIDVLIERRFTNLVKKAAASGTCPAWMPTSA
jgi:paraquat-inducible protein B